MRPAEVERQLKTATINYLDAALPIGKGMTAREREIFTAFQNNDMQFVRPPYLERTKEYKNATLSLGQLADQGLLHREVANAFAKYLLDDDNATPAQVYPYEHQYNSLRALSEGQNLVICTGTGSGKTESFLLPIINRIFEDKIAHPAARKVRLLILYPMNALVNDQIRRLRKILKYLPSVTFGCYTGETDKRATELNLHDINTLGEIPQPFQAEIPVLDENALPNEFLNRARWENEADGPADILVTNYSMLERLLLLPHSRIFDDCWDFIVIDEAHSYSGSLGTEISWLMRRLEYRMRPENVDRAPIRYVAASATLSDGDDQEAVAREFAMNLFPIDDRNSIHVEFGTAAVPDGTDARPLNDDIRNFLERNRELYDRTIAHESRRNTLKELGRQIPVIQSILDNGNTGKAVTIWNLASRLDRCQTPIVRNETIRYLISFYRACRGNAIAANPKKLSVFLEINYSQAQDLIREWGGQADNNAPLSWLGFAYLYEVSVLLAQERPDWDLRIPDFPVQLTDEAAGYLRNIFEGYTRDRATVDNMKAGLNNAWNEVLGFPQPSVASYPELLYRSLVTHNQVEAVAAQLDQGPQTFPELCQNLEIAPNQLQSILDLTALAIPPNRRMPLLDVRYHQVIRDIRDIGIYFEGGDIARPQFVFSEQEFAETGEKVFTLGLCRNCGQPYLLGYAQGVIDSGDADCHEKVFRAKTGNIKTLHAFSWRPPEELAEEPEEDGFPASEDQQCVWLNLMTGDVQTDAPGAQAGWLRVYWLLPPDENGTSFIRQCHRCGADHRAREGVEFGIITPYEAVGQQYRIATLEAFAKLSDPEPDNQIRNTLPAGGRKVLAFSDSRSRAAGLALEFETTKERQLMVRLIRDIVHQYQQPDARPQLQAEIDEIARNMAVMQQQIDNAPNPTLRNTYAQNYDVFHNEKMSLEQLRDGIVSCAAIAANIRQKADELHYPQLLEVEDDAGNRIENEPDLVSNVLVLQALRDRSRNGVIRKGIVKIQSVSIRSLLDVSADEILHQYVEIENDILTSEQIVEICQDFYQYLVCCRRIEVGERAVTDLLDGNYEKKAIKENSRVLNDLINRKLRQFGIINPNSATTRTVRDVVWNIFTNDLTGGGNRQDAILPHNVQGEYSMDLGFICRDLILIPGQAEIADHPGQDDEIMPFVVEEHTAQIHGNLGAVYQQRFSEGRINILSCSTTFEMGIDVGGLNSVFLGNLPPSPANYRQRAGRAGRRPGAAAYILSLAGSSAHDRYYYKNLSQLFWGPVQPPAIYRDRPVFGERHMRAEALHSFLKYLDEQGQGDWNTIGRFLTGYVVTGIGHNRQIRRQNSLCRAYLESWRTAVGTLESLRSIKDYDDFADRLMNYNAVDDLIFQLLDSPINIGGGRPSDWCAEYQRRGGCRLPEVRENQLVESRQFKRQSLEQRLRTRLTYCVNRELPNDEVELLENFGAGRNALQKELFTQTFTILSESCILPKYGFPAEVIRLLPDDDEEGLVDLSRPLQYGLFEYAPGQCVAANKSYYPSRYPVFFFQGRHVDEDFSGRTSYCPHCQKVFDIPLEEDSLQNCPDCGRILVRKRYSRPDAFKAGPSRRTRPLPAQRGNLIIRWGGSLCNCRSIGGLHLTTAESETRMMQYINAGTGGRGFLVGTQGNREQGVFFIHEVQTNIAIWTFTGDTPFQNEVYQDGNRGYVISRTLNAHRSVLYALRRSIAENLNVATRDIGALLEWPRGEHPRYVFYDTAAGGAGCALALVMRSENDTETARRIREIVDGAIDSLEHDRDARVQSANHFPIPPNILATMNEQEVQRYRLAASCYDCLKDFDNQLYHDILDVPDALVILRSFAANGTVGAEQQNLPGDIAGRYFVPFDAGQGAPDYGSFILKQDRTVVQYWGDVDTGDILGIEGLRENN